MFNYKNTIYALANQINAAGSDYSVMTIFYPHDSVAVYIYYRGNCEFNETLADRISLSYWQGVIDVLYRYRDVAIKERSIA